MEIAVFNRSVLDPLAFAFQVRALNIQMRDHFIPAWSADRWAAVGQTYRLPGGDVPWVVAGYDRMDDLDPGAFWPMTLVDQVPDGILGEHDYFGGLISARWKPNLADELDATTGSHEATEMRGDPPCNLWIPGATAMYAAESSDPVQADSYRIPVTLFGETREIAVSNFVLPAWFTPGSPGPYDFLGRCARPLEIRPGGYAIIMQNGQVGQLFGRAPDGGDDPRARTRFMANLCQPQSRTARRIAAARTGAPYR